MKRSPTTSIAALRSTWPPAWIRPRLAPKPRGDSGTSWTSAPKHCASTGRKREIGVRVALGASPGAVLTLVVWQGLRLLGVGLVLGLAAALLLSRTIASLLYGVTATDVPTLLVVCATLTGVTVLATYLPAMRAARVDPLIAMRAD